MNIFKKHRRQAARARASDRQNYEMSLLLDAITGGSDDEAEIADARLMADLIASGESPAQAEQRISASLARDMFENVEVLD